MLHSVIDNVRISLSMKAPFWHSNFIPLVITRIPWQPFTTHLPSLEPDAGMEADIVKKSWIHK